MTHEELSKFRNIQKEISIIKSEMSCIDVSKTTDKVKGSTPTFPYIQTSFNISGYDLDSYYAKLNRLTKKLEKKLNELMDERDRLNDYIQSIDDSIMRMILKLKHIDGQTWNQIGDQIGYTERQCRRKYKKFFEKMESEKK